METTPQLTRGQQVMSVQFNPNQREDVAAIKQIFADAYDEIDKWISAKIPSLDGVIINSSEMSTEEINLRQDVLRLAAIAKTNLETAQMYAVKAVTR